MVIFHMGQRHLSPVKVWQKKEKEEKSHE